MSVHHAHVSTAARDCDGPIFSDYVVTYNDDEIAESQQDVNDFSDIHFRERVLGLIVSLTTFRDGLTGRLDVTEHGFDWSQQTEEGHSSASVTWCDNDYCDTGARSQRDVFAEQMGY